MVGKFVDIVGQKFGRLVALERAESTKWGKAAWVCLCVCGEYVTVSSNSLRRGLVRSCGCLRKDGKTLIDVTDQKFGRLVVLERAGSDRWSQAMWRCRCDCGNWVNVSGYGLRSGNTRSCGCLQKDVVTVHGKSHTRAYYCWASMKDRCINPRSCSYKDYGGRGISICEDFQTFESFYSLMGDPPDGKSLDRVNNDGDYCRENCRWATPKEQANNRRDPRKETSLSNMKSCNVFPPVLKMLELRAQ